MSGGEKVKWGENGVNGDGANCSSSSNERKVDGDNNTPTGEQQGGQMPRQ